MFYVSLHRDLTISMEKKLCRVIIVKVMEASTLSKRGRLSAQEVIQNSPELEAKKMRGQSWQSSRVTHSCSYFLPRHRGILICH